jgi:hypothetical protein
MLVPKNRLSIKSDNIFHCITTLVISMKIFEKIYYSRENLTDILRGISQKNVFWTKMKEY